MTRMLVRTLAALPLLLLLLAGPARASIVYDQPDRIVVAHDDGSAPETLVTLADTPGMSTLNAPAVSPHGTTVVFEGLDPVFDPRAAAACGDRCSGVYEDAGGRITRLTPLMPAACSDPCALIEGQPEIGPTGQVVASYLWADYVEWTGPDGIAFWDIAQDSSWTGLTSPPHGSPVDGATAADLPTPCSGHDISVQPQYPSLSADGTKLVYANCESAGGAFETVTADAHGNGATVCGTDDAAITDPSWSLDGSRVVDAEAGGDPGLWDYACPLADAVYALAAPAGVTFQSPRYDGSGRILFVAVQGSGDQQTSDVYAIAAGCGRGGTPCRFPQDATRVTRVGNVGNVAWTSATIPVPAPPAAGGTPGGGASGGGAPGVAAPPPAAPTPATPSSGAPKTLILLVAVAGRHLLRFAHGRLPISVRCATACSGTLAVTVAAKTAGQAHLGRRALTLARGPFHAGANHTATVRLKVSHARRRALRHVRKLAVRLTAKPTSGPAMQAHGMLRR